MAETLKKLRRLSNEISVGTKKRKNISVILKSTGFIAIGKGGWLGFRGRDIVSGILIEGSPSDTYLSSFVLPIFDELKFVTWSLGRRLVHCSTSRDEGDECAEALSNYFQEVFPVNTPKDLIDYIDRSNKDGFYAIWSRYICLLRMRKLEEAEDYLTAERRQSLHASITAKLDEIENFVADRDYSEVDLVLQRWETVSRLIFGNGNFSTNILVT